MYDDDIGSAWGFLQMHTFTHSHPNHAPKLRYANGSANNGIPASGCSDSPLSSQSPTDPISPAVSTSSTPRSPSVGYGRTYHPPSHTRARAYRPVRFPTRNITTPIVLLYGTADLLVDIDMMLAELPQHSTSAIPLEDYEHLDVLWGRNIHEDVIPEVINALRTWCERGREVGNLQETNALKVSEKAQKSITMDKQ